MKWITVREMSQKYGISHQCIYKKIDCNRHKLGDHIREEYRKPKLLDEVAVEQLRPKNKEITHRKNDMETVMDSLFSCERMCSENAAEIHALSEEFHLFKENVLRKLISITADIQRMSSTRNEQLTFSDDLAGIRPKHPDGEEC